MDNDGGLKKVYDPNAGRILRTGAIEFGNITLYTVPAAHNFYLEEASLSIEFLEQQGPSSGFLYIYWLTATAYYVRDICQIWIWINKFGEAVRMTRGDHAIFPSGLLIPAGDMIELVGGCTGIEAEGNISGFLVSDYA